MSFQSNYSRLLNRRKFLKISSSASLAANIIPSSALGKDGSVASSDRINIAVIGNGGRFMRALLPAFIRQTDVQLTAVCDCWKERREKAKAAIDMRYGNNDCTAYRFHEEILERKDIDAVIIATGDRWHAVLSILAARAGKDVYSEKPYCLSIDEGRTLVEQTKKYGTVWQCGTQRHNNPDYKYIIDTVHQGKIGKLHTITTGLGDWSGNGNATPEPVPAGFDYDRWLGQSPWRPYSPISVGLWRNHWIPEAESSAIWGLTCTISLNGATKAKPSLPSITQAKPFSPKRDTAMFHSSGMWKPDTKTALN